jgi:hypothetical protein
MTTLKYPQQDQVTKKVVEKVVFVRKILEDPQRTSAFGNS